MTHRIFLFFIKHAEMVFHTKSIRKWLKEIKKKVYLASRPATGATEVEGMRNRGSKRKEEEE